MSGKVKSILIEAEEIVSGTRQEDYGPPEDSFNMIGNLWMVYLNGTTSGTCNEVIVLSATDVAHMMILLKVARNAHRYKRDNAVDIAGYARALEMIAEGE